MRLNLLSATELIPKINNKTVSIEALCRDCLDAISLKEGKIKAWEYLNEGLILKYAKELDKKRKLEVLSGIPIGIKDIFNTKDMPTAMGSSIWKGFTPGNDARVVHNIRMLDGLIFGKTVTAEFAVHHLPSNKTTNPHHPRYSPGTSSSGSAAAVAAYMVPLALGTQTGGSIIRPASYCGIFGFKPSFGIIPRTGMLKTTDTLDTVGCFARSIDDIRLLFDAIRVQGKDYPFVYRNLKECPSSYSDKKWKVGYINKGINVFGKFEKYALDAFDSYIDNLSSLNKIKLIKINPSLNFNKIHTIHSILYDKTLSYYFKEEFKMKTLMSRTMYQIIERGNKISTAEYIHALERQSEIRADIDKELKDFDVVLTLSTAGEAPRIGEGEKPDACLIWTFLGYPSLNIPKFHGPKKLPFGLQAVAKKYDDYKLLLIAKQISINN